MTIRDCKLKDFEIVLHFLNELQGKKFNPKSLRPMFEANIRNPENIYLLAEDDGEVVGYVSCHVQLLLHHAGRVAEIQEIFVSEAHRSMGVGKALIEEIKKIATSKDIVQLEVTTRKVRQKAIKFYKREHFQDSHSKLGNYF